MHAPVAKQGVAASIFPLSGDTDERPAQRLVSPQSRHTVTYSTLRVTWQGRNRKDLADQSTSVLRPKPSDAFIVLLKSDGTSTRTRHPGYCSEVT
ncbi:hypothetical protein MRX96_005236 [Rhipicephalus microplus]